MQGLSTFLVLLAAALAAMLAGHVALSGARGRGLALAFLLGFAAQTGLLGLLWLRPDLVPTGLRATIGAALPGLLFLFFARSRTASPGLRRHDAWHATPPVAVGLLVASGHSGWWIDALLLVLELGYALALLSTDRRDDASPLRRRARLGAAAFLLAMAACDIWIAWQLTAGAPLAETGGLRLAFLLLALASGGLFAWAWRNPEWLVHLRGAVLPSPSHAPSSTAEADTTPGERVLCERLDRLFATQRLHAEFGIGLDAVARRLSVTPRELSLAVNHVHQRGFRTLLNDRRVADAATQLADPALADKPITHVMFDAGFQTKSNFNKEFSARLGETPSGYRRERVTRTGGG